MKLRIFILVSLASVICHQALGACDPNIPADLSGDCHVDFNDFAIMAADWLKPAVPHEWLARYNGPGNSGDYAYAIAVDSNDNIYVTGGSYGSGTDLDYATVKYSADSNQPVWVARYSGPGNAGDWAKAIAVDSNDNIYVTGVSYVSGTDYDYATIKYSPDTNQPVWVARYNGPAGKDDVAFAIVVDSKDNIYVTGRSHGYGTDNDYATIKYSADANEPIWVARYNGPGDDYDGARAIALDSKDNIYVTGWSIGSANDYDYATIKYSPDTNHPVWVARYNGPGNGYDWAEAMAVDSSDNIYVTGRSPGSSTDNDYATVRYSPDSNQPVWVARYNSPGNDDVAIAIAIDSRDDIYVTGSTYPPGDYPDYLTIKYSPDSNEAVWVARYNGPGNRYDEPTAVALDSNDNIYVTGWSYDFVTSADYATVKYAPDYTCTPPVTGDFDLDCDVDIYDLEILCQSWLDSTTPSI